MDENAKVPDIYELASIFYNKRLYTTVNTSSGGGEHWSSSYYSVNSRLLLVMGNGHVVATDKNRTFKTRCIKR